MPPRDAPKLQEDPPCPRQWGQPFHYPLHYCRSSLVFLQDLQQGQWNPRCPYCCRSCWVHPRGQKKPRCGREEPPEGAAGGGKSRTSSWHNPPLFVQRILWLRDGGRNIYGGRSSRNRQWPLTIKVTAAAMGKRAEEGSYELLRTLPSPHIMTVSMYSYSQQRDSNKEFTETYWLLCDNCSVYLQVLDFVFLVVSN